MTSNKSFFNSCTSLCVCVCVLVAGGGVPLSGFAGTGLGGSETESAAHLSARSLQREAQQSAAPRPALSHPLHGEYARLPCEWL